MMTRRQMLGLLAGALGTEALGSSARLAADDEKQPPKDKDKEKKRSGTVIGVVTDRGDNWVEVKAAGEEKARRYVPHWVGGQPKDGGGPDKKMVEKIKKLEVGSRVRLEWEFEERPRVIKLEMLKEPEKK